MPYSVFLAPCVWMGIVQSAKSIELHWMCVCVVHGWRSSIPNVWENTNCKTQLTMSTFSLFFVVVLRSVHVMILYHAPLLIVYYVDNGFFWHYPSNTCKRPHGMGLCAFADTARNKNNWNGRPSIVVYTYTQSNPWNAKRVLRRLMMENQSK